MTPEQFEAAWDGIMAKLSPDERELVETTLAGAEANHTIVFICIAALLGALAGFAAARLF